MNKIRRVFIIVPACFALISAGYVLRAPILNKVGSALIRSDEIKPADAIVVLAGDGTGERMNAGIRLLKNGYGKFIVFSGGTFYWKISYSELFLRQLKENGIGEDQAVWSAEKLPEVSTRGEAFVNMRLLTNKHAESFILVTSDYHSARAGRVYDGLAKKNGMTMRVHPVKDMEVFLDGWWKDRTSAKMVLLEWEKTVWYLF